MVADAEEHAPPDGTRATGMNKMVINHLEKLFVTSDAATIVRELEVAHPAARLVVLAAQAQEAEAAIGEAGASVCVCGGGGGA